MTSRLMTLARYTTTGAQVKTIGSAPVGVKSSFIRTFRPWTTDSSDPNGPDPVRARSEGSSAR